MRKTLVLLSLVFSIAAQQAQAESRFVTLSITAPNDTSATLTVATNETVRFVSGFSSDIGAAGVVKVEKAGRILLNERRIGTPDGQMNADTMRVVVAGPATVTLYWVGTPGATEPPPAAFLTVEMLPGSSSPDKTVVIPADTKGADIIMESSTDLANWSPALPGVYASVPPSHLFFRIRAERLPE